mgnify:FL=1
MKLLEFDSFETEQEKRERQLQEPAVAKKNVFIYTVYEDDEETEAFHADVRDPNGTIIFEIKKKDFPENPEEEEEYELEEEKEGSVPKMHDANDIQNLRKILIAKGKMTENDVLMSNEVYKESGEVEKPEVPPVNINMMENNQYGMKYVKLFEEFSINEGTRKIDEPVILLAINSESAEDFKKKLEDYKAENPDTYINDVTDAQHRLGLPLNHENDPKLIYDKTQEISK